MTTYRKLMVSGLPVKIFKGIAPRYIQRLLSLDGIHLEISTKEEYEKLRKLKPKADGPEQLRLF